MRYFIIASWFRCEIKSEECKTWESKNVSGCIYGKALYVNHLSFARQLTRLEGNKCVQFSNTREFRTASKEVLLQTTFGIIGSSTMAKESNSCFLYLKKVEDEKSKSRTSSTISSIPLSRKNSNLYCLENNSDSSYQVTISCDNIQISITRKETFDY